MEKTITKEWLAENNACKEACEWINEQPTRNTQELIDKCLEARGDKLDWLNCYLSKALSRKNKIRYAVYAAEQVLGIFEAKYPDDKRPRQAIEAAKEVVKNDNEKTAADAAYAASAAYAADADNAANAAAFAAANAASAANAAYAAYAADAAAFAAANAANAFNVVGQEEMRIKILTYGIKLLKD